MRGNDRGAVITQINHVPRLLTKFYEGENNIGQTHLSTL